MSLLSRSNAVFLLCFLFLLSVAIPHSSVPTQVIDQSMSSGLARQVVSIVSLGPIVKTTLGLSVAQPIIQGWGGVTLDEAANGQLQPTLSRLNQSGYNGVRIGFSGSVTHCPSGELGSWSPDWFNQTIHLAQQYGLWVILDYHSYADLVDSTCQAQWLLFWNSVLSVDWRYDRIVWEPINEPAGSVAVLSSAYQAWITLARGLGDKHWIAVENTISNDGCNFDPLSLVNCYPKVTDPLNQTFLSIHPYLFYDLWQSISSTYGVCSSSSANPWGNGTAECVANVYNQGMLQASGKYHRPIPDTEGGAVYYSCNNVCVKPPDAVGTDDASYSITTLHFHAVSHKPDAVREHGLALVGGGRRVLLRCAGYLGRIVEFSASESADTTITTTTVSVQPVYRIRVSWNASFLAFNRRSGRTISHRDHSHAKKESWKNYGRRF